jgi:hypothetical protein
MKEMVVKGGKKNRRECPSLPSNGPMANKWSSPLLLHINSFNFEVANNSSQGEGVHKASADTKSHRNLPISAGDLPRFKMGIWRMENV